MRKIICAFLGGFIVLSLVVVLLVYPIFIRIDDSIDLGSGYRYIQDHPQSIIHHASEKYKGTGNEVIPPLVLEYNYNESFTIAKTKDIKTKNTIFWIVEKSKMKSEIYLDFIEFCKQVKDRNINLILKSNYNRIGDF